MLSPAENPAIGIRQVTQYSTIIKHNPTNHVLKANNITFHCYIESEKKQNLHLEIWSSESRVDYILFHKKEIQHPNNMNVCTHRMHLCAYLHSYIFTFLYCVEL